MLRDSQLMHHSRFEALTTWVGALRGDAIVCNALVE